MEEPIYNVDELITILIKIRNKINENVEVFIKDVYATDEYLRISNIRVDGEGDIIIENNIR